MGFYDRIQRSKEGMEFLRDFHEGEAHQFAVIKVSDSVLESSQQAIVADLSYLHRLGLYPIVVHGYDSPSDVTKGRKKLKSLRTSTDTLASFDKINSKIVSKIVEDKGDAQGLIEGVFEVDKPSKSSRTNNSILRVHQGPIVSAIEYGKIPVIGALGYDRERCAYRLNADAAAEALVISLRPKKFILLTQAGGILDSKERLISEIKTRHDLKKMIEGRLLKAETKSKLKEIDNLLERLGEEFTVQVTSPERLFPELFTKRGSGTLIRLGYNIKPYRQFGKLDRKRLKGLIESGFGKTLASDYFEKTKPAMVYLEKNYHGVAIVARPDDRFCLDSSEEKPFYLDKFVVDQPSQGYRLGSDIWESIVSDSKKLFWRSRPDNPLNYWYYDNADRCYKADRWNVFSLGLSGPDFERAVEYALKKEDTVE